MFLSLVVFIFGLCFGSFINAFQYRAQVDKKITGRSLCPKCQHQLVWSDLVPLLSWLVLRGRCRYCHKSISIQYPIVELLAGLSFVAVGLKSGYIQKLTNVITLNSVISLKDLLIIIISLLALYLIISCLIIIGLHDYKTKYVLSGIVYIAIIASLFLLLINYQHTWSFWPLFRYLYPYFAPAIIAGSIFFLIHFLSKGTWMGAGDIEIAVLMGLFLGWPDTAIAFYVAFFVGAIIGIILLVANKAKMKTEVPFGPFLISGTLVAYLFSTQIISFYDRIFLGF